MRPLIFKFTQVNQYNPDNQTIDWADAMPARWQNLYAPAPIGTRAFFVGQGKIYSGTLQSVTQNVSMHFTGVDVFNLTADHLLSIDAIHPEENARVKALFKPYLAEKEVDYAAFKNDATNRRFLRFMIIKESQGQETAYNEHDRIVFIDEAMVFKKFCIFSKGILQEYPEGTGFFNVKDKSIFEAIQLFEKITSKSDNNRSNNAAQLKRIAEYLKTHDEFRFKTFSSYFNTIHNKKAYLYSNISRIKYFTVGSFWKESDPQDQTSRFLLNNTWANGYDDKFTEDVNAVPVGSMVALKTTNKSYNELIIKCIGEVKANPKNGHDLDVEWEENFEGFRLPYSGGYWDTINPVTKKEHIRDIFFHQKETTVQNVTEDTRPPLNQILYGPPGTGKTFNTIDLAVRIINPAASNDHEENKALFDDLVETRQVEFVTFHQNYSYEDFMVGMRPDITSETLKFKPYQGVFYNIADRARKNYLAANDQRYVLIIDEINRANISRVFGELITLLEDDKRIGATNALKITLPNGELDFCLPPNLFIIGTMNTADKSISLVDIALRRRFDFIGYYPDPKVLVDNQQEKRVRILTKINEAIYKKKNTADYLIGHAYFLSEDSTKNILLKKIIPLLCEYFGNRNQDITDVFKGTGWKPYYNTTTYTWEIELHEDDANAA